ncbi:MAG: nicotinate-nucleotide adenylyltransferase [Chloroflexota bacterium]
MLTRTHKIGLMCGTFDPPHNGHLILAQTALSQLELDEILFLPVGDPTHKTTGTPAAHRLKMTRLAVADNSKFSVSDIDTVRPEPHYTATLLPLIHQTFPQAQYWLIIGGDSLQTFPTWHQPNEILELCRLAVLPRSGFPVKLKDVSSKVPKILKNCDELHGPSIQLSSTWLRNQLSTQSTVRYLVPPSVVDYVTKNELYG